jgi:hypothetical protein
MQIPCLLRLRLESLGTVLEGKLRSAKLRLVLAWIEIHQDELMANWELAAAGEQIFKIDPLR